MKSILFIPNLLLMFSTPLPAAPPNVLFILADDLGYGDLASYGNPYIETPVIDSLAAKGVRFTSYYSPSPLCAPARAGLLTGRYNHRTGAIDVSSNRGIDRIALSEKTFGDYFNSAGYRTALIGKWHNGLYSRDYLPHNRGFDLFMGFANGQQDYWNWNLQRNDEMLPHDGRYMTDVFNQEAARFIRDSAKTNKPFAVFLSHHPPHPPYQAPQHLVDKYTERLEGRYDNTVAIIYAMIEQMDTGLQWVLDALQETGQLDNTIIVFTSDNGAHLGGSTFKGESCKRFDGGFRGNKGNVLEQGIRVPAVVSWRGNLPEGSVVDTPVHGTDWLPTLFAQTGQAAPDGAKPMDGHDIWPILTGKSRQDIEPRDLFFQKNRYTPVAHSDAAIRSGKWKLYWPGEKSTMKKDIGRDNPSFERGCLELPWEMPIDPGLPDYSEVVTKPPELYNIESDPGEATDLAGAHPHIVTELTVSYDDWFSGVFADWQAAFAEIRRHDELYWENRDIPDPAILYKNYWQWDRSPGTDRKTDNPLDVFKGYWNHENH